MKKIEYNVIKNTKLVEKLINLEEEQKGIFNQNLYVLWESIANDCIKENSIQFANGYHEDLNEELIDMEIYNQLTPEQQKYIDDWDLFLHQEDGKIIMSDWDEEWKYDSIEELQDTLDYDIEETKKLGLDNLDEAVIEEASEEDTRAKALAKYFDESVEAIEVEDDNLYSLPMGETYLVLTEDEAYQAAEEEIREVFDELGLEAFTPNFQDYILNNCLDEDIIQEFINEEMEYFATQEEDQEMVDYLSSLSGSDAIAYVRDLFNDHDFSKWAIEQNAFDIDEIVDEAISQDGVAHFIATYDGEELDLGNNLYAYRVG